MAAKKLDREDYDYVPFKCTPNMAKVCRFLISEHPDLIRKQIHGQGHLPIHKLANRCNRPLVQQMTILLIKSFPECLQIKAIKRDPGLPTIPFIQQVHPLIMNELEIDEEGSQLTEIMHNVKQAATLSKVHPSSTSGSTSSSWNSSLFDSVAEIFCSWANLRVFDVLKARKRRIQELIADSCHLTTGDDVSDDDEDDEEDEEEDDDMDEDSGSESWYKEGAPGYEFDEWNRDWMY